MSKTNYTISIDVEVIEKIREIAKNKPKGYFSFEIEKKLRELIEQEGGIKYGIRKEEES